MKTFKRYFGLSLAALTLVTASLRAHDREKDTLESAADSVAALSDIPLKGIPPALLRDAAGVAVIPNVVKVGLVVDGRFGRGVVLAHQADGGWSNPIFLTLAGGGVGWQVGIQSTDVVLIFKTRKSLDRILRGKDKVTLGADVGVAAGPVGRQVEADTDGQLKAEIYSYSRSRGLFAGVSLEGAGLLVDHGANEAFYGTRDIRPADVLDLAPNEAEDLVRLKNRLVALSRPGIAPPAVIVVPEVIPPPRRGDRP